MHYFLFFLQRPTIMNAVRASLRLTHTLRFCRIRRIALSASLHTASAECSLSCTKDTAYEMVLLPPPHHTLLISWGIFRFQWGRGYENRSSDMSFAKRNYLSELQ